MGIRVLKNAIFSPADGIKKNGHPLENAEGHFIVETPRSLVGEYNLFAATRVVLRMRTNSYIRKLHTIKSVPTAGKNSH